MLEVNSWTETYHTNSKYKKAGVAIKNICHYLATPNKLIDLAIDYQLLLVSQKDE